VVLREDVPGDKRLLAYFVAENPPADLVDQLRAVVRAAMPEYMVPAHFIALDALPLTPNGKVDRRRLPVPERSASVQVAYLPPRTRTEGMLASIWVEVLGVKRVGIDDDFFELGGHSLMVVRLIGKIDGTLKVSIAAREVFENPTVGQMARVIDGKRSMSKPRPAVIQLQKGRAELPVYFIYAGPDEFRLAQRMGERHPVFGIDVLWPLPRRNAVADNRRSAFPSMEQLVAPYVAALSAHTRSSRYSVVPC
jgi:acyl carrier protein